MLGVALANLLQSGPLLCIKAFRDTDLEKLSERFHGLRVLLTRWGDRADPRLQADYLYMLAIDWRKVKFTEINKSLIYAA